MAHPQVTPAVHQAGLDRMALLVNEPGGGALVATDNGQGYCLVHVQLFQGAGGARELRGADAVGTADMFEDHLDAAILQHPQAFALHRRVYVVPLSGDAGLTVATAIWHSVLIASTTEKGQNQNRPNSWRAGDAVYVHYPVDDGIGFVGAVIPNDGDPLPNWP